MENNPLVSICIVTYNSGQTILETLESAKAQTYQNIELIVSDDCSRDNTVDIVRHWIEENKSRFVDARVITTAVNTGVSANLNRCIKSANGEWIKSLAGDDIFLPSCIEYNIDFVNKNPDANVIFSNMQKFYQWNDKEEQMEADEYSRVFFDKIEPDEQLIMFLKKTPKTFAPTAFIRASVLKASPYDERFRNVEDLPKWVDLLSKGIHFDYLDKITIKYRVFNNLSQVGKDHYYNPKMFDSTIHFFYACLKPLMIEKGLLDDIKKKEKEFTRYFFTMYAFNNKKNKTLIPQHFDLTLFISS